MPAPVEELADDPFDRLGLRLDEDPDLAPAGRDLAGNLALEEPELRPASPRGRLVEGLAPAPPGGGFGRGPDELLEPRRAPAVEPALHDSPAAPEPVVATPPAPAPLPPPRTKGPAEVQGAGRAALRSAVAVVALLAVAAATFTAVVSSQRRSERGPGGATVSGVSSVLYDTAAGRPVLVVRGELRAGSTPLAAPQLDVALVDGDRIVARGRALAGAVPAPEEVFAVDGAAGTERLAALLAVRARPRLEPGESAPFGAVIADLPAGAERLSVRVSVAP